MMGVFTWFFSALLYFPVFYSLYRERWGALDYTHAYYILPVSLWMAWCRRRKIQKILQDRPASNERCKKIAFGDDLPAIFAAPLLCFRRKQEGYLYTFLYRDKESLSGLLILGAGLVLFIFGWRKEYLFITTFSFIPVVYGMVGFLYGREIRRLLLFPIGYLLFLVPLPSGLVDSLTIPMRHGVSIISEIILAALHYPVTREGLLLSVGGHDLFMGPPCSGFRSLVTMLAVGAVYAHFSVETFRKKWILFLSVIPLAILGNLLRVLALCLVAFYFGNKAAEGGLHDLSGVLIFLIMMLGLMGLGHWLNKTKQC